MGTNSKDLFTRAKKVIPGGVNSPVRAFKSVGGEPLFISKAYGSKIVDADGKEYIDYVGSWGPMIAGHTNPRVLKAIKDAADLGSSFGAPTEAEIELAQKVIDTVPSIEMVRLVNSGTEAVMSAIRLARAFTRRDKIIKFEGCYHGHADYLLVKAGSGAATLGLPDSPGVPSDFAKHTLTLPYNNLDSLKELIAKEGDQVACVILEPVVGNAGCILPEEGFLEGVRELTRKSGILLIFDEVMTGFRVSLGGAQEKFNIAPDLTTLGKVIGGGLPVGAYGGRKEIMEMVAPSGPVYQAGTLSGNPLAMAAGLEMLSILSEPGTYEKLTEKTEKLTSGISAAARQAGIKTFSSQIGAMFSLYFTDQPVTDFDSAKLSDTNRFSKWFSLMLEQGIYFAPSQFEAGFTSLAHSDDDIQKTIDAATSVFKHL
ncbi:MAG: glutamate-1-semialdehyde 2,1-aminomutase [Nitrospinota bacterium]